MTTPFLSPDYFAPDYFPPGYNAGGPAPPISPAGLPGGIYWAPGYFARSYFPPAYFPGTPGSPVLTPVVLPTTLAAVLAAIRSMLIASGVAPAQRVVISLSPDVFPAASGPMCVVCPGGFTPVAAHQVGLGRSLATMEGSFTVDVVDRAARDLAQQDTLRLLTASTGLLDVAHSVMDALNLIDVEDDAGNFLSIEPMRIQGHATPRQYPKAPEWAGLELTFGLAYVARMS